MGIPEDASASHVWMNENAACSSSKMIYTVRQADQQLQIHHLYDKLGHQLLDSQACVTMGIQQASTLQDTIRNLRMNLWANETGAACLDSQEYNVVASSRSRNDMDHSGIIPCRKCGNNVLKSLYSKHSKSCLANTGPGLATNTTSNPSNHVLRNKNHSLLKPSVQQSSGKTKTVSVSNHPSKIHSSTPIRVLAYDPHDTVGQVTRTLPPASQDQEIAMTRKLVQDRDLHKVWCSQRDCLIHHIENMQIRISHTIHPEMNRIRHALERSTNPSFQSIETTFLHGSKQMVDTERIQAELSTKLMEAEQAITSWQVQIQKGDEEDQHLVDQMICSFIQLQHHRHTTKDDSYARMGQIRMRDNVLLMTRHTFHGWRMVASTRRKRFIHIQRLVTLLRKHYRRNTFQRWIDYGSVWLEKKNALLASSMSSHRTFTGIGDESLKNLEQTRLQDLQDLHLILNSLSSVTIKHDLSSSTVSWLETSDSMVPLGSNETEMHRWIQKARVYYEVGEYLKAADFYRKALDHVIMLQETFTDDAVILGSNTMTLSEAISTLYLYIMESYLQAHKPNYVLVFIDKLLTFIEHGNFEGDREKRILKTCLYYAHEWASALPAEDLASQALLLLKTRCSDNRPESKLALANDSEINVIQSLHDKLDEMTSTLYRLPTLSGATTKELPRVSTHHYSLLQQQADLLIQIEEKKRVCTGLRTKRDKVLDTQTIINDELKETKMKKGKIASKLIHEQQEILVDVRELRERLQDKQHMIYRQLDVLKVEEENIMIEMNNLQDEIKDVDSEIELEQCGLLQSMLKKKHVRCARIYMEDGIPESYFLAVLSIDKEIYVHDMKSNKLKVAFFGDHRNDHSGEIQGHLSTITCVDISHSFVFSGSLDKNIICWDMTTGKLHFIARGHESTITCIRWTEGNILISGSLDKTLIKWDHKGTLLSRIQGHPTSIIAIDCNTRHNISMDADAQIFVWTKDFRCTRTIRASIRGKTTVIKWGGSEWAYGDSKGYVGIWTVDSMQLILENKVHSSSVTDLHLDAIKCISCGHDGCVRVLDRIVGGVIFSYGTLGVPFLSLYVSNLQEMIYVISDDWKVHQLPLNKHQTNPSVFLSAKGQNQYRYASSAGWSGTSLASRIMRDNN